MENGICFHYTTELAPSLDSTIPAIYDISIKLFADIFQALKVC